MLPRTLTILGMLFLAGCEGPHVFYDCPKNVEVGESFTLLLDPSFYIPEDQVLTTSSVNATVRGGDTLSPIITPTEEGTVVITVTVLAEGRLLTQQSTCEFDAM